MKILTPFHGERRRVLQQVEDSARDLLNEVGDVGRIVLKTYDGDDSFVTPLGLWFKDVYLIQIGISGGHELDRMAQKSAQGLIWAILCHELGHVRQWRLTGFRSHTFHQVPTLVLAYEHDAWRRAECDILPQLPFHMLREVLKVWYDLKTYALGTYEERIRSNTTMA